MSLTKNSSGVLSSLRGDDQFMTNVTAWRTLPSKPATYTPLPAALHPTLQSILQKRGIQQLYSHQGEAIQQTLGGAHIAVVTPTASGKTLCYNLPILHSLCEQPQQARAIYLFPTKALAQDQLTELQRWQVDIGKVDICEAEGSQSQINVATYDGDTPSGRRATIRRAAQIILTNPDMLHMGILPYHANWADFFAQLRWVVLDEMHIYRGIFGSHVANVLRRLQRICAFYGSAPQFICTSATIANPDQLAQQLIEQPVTVISKNGAPRSAKEIILYNPPTYDPEAGTRRSSTLVTQELAARCVLGGAQTLVFGRSRLTTEVLLTYLRDQMKRRRPALEKSAWEIGDQKSEIETVRGYRAGYLPAERRAIEAGLRSGEIKAVVATNALELGIDIGQLQVVLLCGYPGSIASTWQQIGRAGRRVQSSADCVSAEEQVDNLLYKEEDSALAILVATGGPLDQYVIQNPEFLFERSPERAMINPDNLALLIDQVRCALFELPFQTGESFGQSPHTEDVLTLLTEEGAAHSQQGRFFWADEGYPARQVNLRSASNRRVMIQAQMDETNPYVEALAGEVDFMSADQVENISEIASEPVTIGEIDQESAIHFLHKGAVYLHEGASYLIESLDLENELALVRPATVDYYTEVITDTELTVEEVYDQRVESGGTVAHGDLTIQSQVVGYRRVQNFTHENLGVVPLEYPPSILATNGYWLDISPTVQEALEDRGLWYDSPNNYGPNWQQARQAVRARDRYCCTQCGRPEAPEREHDVHHLIPFRTFGYVPRLNENYRAANKLENLVLVCRTCHQRLESLVRVRTGLDGLGYVLHNLAPLYLMCDRQDINVHSERQPSSVGSGNEAAATLYIYERVVAGLGFSKRLFELHRTLLAAAQEFIEKCGCENGCPACVGPVLEDGGIGAVQLPTKRLTLALIGALVGALLVGE